jgi:3'(2'), 5'-bisphosphate nucleotidase
MFDHELSSAIALARTAGREILEFYKTDFLAEEKLGVDDHYEPVTDADRIASRIIVDGLSAAFPDDAVLSEEEPDEPENRLSKNRVWIIDPLDGTAGFVKRDGDFSVQIGLAENGRAVAGVVYQPYHDLMIYGSLGGGAFAEKDGEKRRLGVSAISELGGLKLAMSRNHASPRMKRVIEHFRFADVIRRGSVGLKVGLIAEKTCDIYIHPSPRTKVWDTCGPQIILEEAGGRFTDIFGGEFRYDRLELQNFNGILATNGVAHEAAARHLGKVLREFGRRPHVYG